MDDDDKKVHIAVRLRPRRQFTDERYDTSCAHVVNGSSDQGGNGRQLSIVNPETREAHSFEFDTIFDDSDGQDVVYSDVISQPLGAALDGGDLTVLAYGQTGSGKTHTMLGAPYESMTDTPSSPMTSPSESPLSRLKSPSSSGLQLAVNSGVFLRVMNDILAFKAMSSSNLHVVVLTSALEIYNEAILDLLNKKQTVKLSEAGDDLLPINNRTIAIDSHHDVRRLFEIASSQRAVAATCMNDESSRSHALFLVDVFLQERTSANPNPPDPAALNAFVQKRAQQQVQRTVGTAPRFATASRVSGGQDAVKTMSSSNLDATVSSLSGTCNDDFAMFPFTRSRITLIDLAGSERLKRSGAVGSQMNEAMFVNKSLSALGHVVNHMCMGSKHIPFRDTKMTRILRPTFVSPRARIVFIAAISPTSTSFTETLGTMRFAARLKDIKPVSVPVSLGPGSILEEAVMRHQRTFDELCADVRVMDTTGTYTRVLRNQSLRGVTLTALKPRAELRTGMVYSKRRAEAKLRDETEAQDRALVTLTEEAVRDAEEARQMKSEIDAHIAKLKSAQEALSVDNAEQRRKVAQLTQQSTDAVVVTNGKADPQLVAVMNQKRHLESQLNEATSLRENFDDLLNKRQTDSRRLKAEVETERNLLVSEKGRAGSRFQFFAEKAVMYGTSKSQCLEAQLATFEVEVALDAAKNALDRWEKESRSGTTSAASPPRAPTLTKNMDILRAQRVMMQVPKGGRIAEEAADQYKQFIDTRLTGAMKVRVVSPLAFYFSPSTTNQPIFYSWGPSPPPSPASTAPTSPRSDCGSRQDSSLGNDDDVDDCGNVPHEDDDVVRRDLLEAHTALLRALGHIANTKTLNDENLSRVFVALDKVVVDQRVVEKVVGYTLRRCGLLTSPEGDHHADGFDENAMARLRSLEEVLPEQVTEPTRRVLRALAQALEDPTQSDVNAVCLMRCLQCHTVLALYDEMAVQDASLSSSNRKAPMARDLSLLRSLCTRLILHSEALSEALAGHPGLAETEDGDGPPPAFPPRFIETVMLCCGYG